MRASIRQVAERAQVSPMTVSHALKGRKGSMSAATYERVMQAVRDLNYVPVHTATQNRHTETRALGVVPFHANLSSHEIDSYTYGGITEGARKHGYDILIMLRDEADWMVNRQDVRFLDRRSDGFIFVSSGVGEWADALSLLVEHQIPSVVCYRRDVPPEIPWIDPDNEEIIRQLLALFRKHGHRRVAYLGNPNMVPTLASSDPNWLISSLTSHPNHDDVCRRAVFEQIMAQESDYWEHYVVTTGTTPYWEIDPEVLPRLRQEGITAAICASDMIALKFIAVMQQAGLNAPDDISIAGTDDFPISEPRGLTTMAFGYKEVGRLAVDAWIELLAGTPASECSRIVPVRLIERTTVGPPPGGKS